MHEWMNALNIHLTTRPNTPARTRSLWNSASRTRFGRKRAALRAGIFDKLAANYNAGLKLVDFSQPEEVRQLINLWVEAQTNEKIKELIPAGMLNELTRR